MIYSEELTESVQYSKVEILLLSKRLLFHCYTFALGTNSASTSSTEGLYVLITYVCANVSGCGCSQGCKQKFENGWPEIFFCVLLVSVGVC